MSDANNSQADGNKIIFPDFAELWKELYFKTEGAWADAFKDFVSTDTFVKMLDQSLTQHLNLEKITRQNIDKFYEMTATPSQKDLARIAELVISVEEKVDNLDYQLVDNINKMADGLLSIIAFLDAGQQQTAGILAQSAALQVQLNDMQTWNVSLQDQLQAVTAQNADIQEQMKGMSREHIGVQNKLSEIKKQNTQLKTQLADMKKQITAYNQKLSTLHVQKEETDSKTRSHKNRNAVAEMAE